MITEVKKWAIQMKKCVSSEKFKHLYLQAAQNMITKENSKLPSLMAEEGSNGLFHKLRHSKVIIDENMSLDANLSDESVAFMMRKCFPAIKVENWDTFMNHMAFKDGNIPDHLL